MWGKIVRQEILERLMWSFCVQSKTPSINQFAICKTNPLNSTKFYSALQMDLSGE